MVHVADRLLAIGPCRFSVISVRVVVALAFQGCGHCGERSAGVAKGHLVSSSTRTSRPQSLAGGKLFTTITIISLGEDSCRDRLENLNRSKKRIQTKR